MKLYEIANNYQQVLQLAEYGDLDEQTAKDTLESISGEFTDKARNCMMIVRQLEASSDAIKGEIERLKALQDQTDKSCDALKDYIKLGMESVGADKLDLGIFKLTLKAPTKAVEIFDESSLPEDYFVIIPESKRPDKTLISKAIKDGFDVAGARLIDGKRALLIK